MGHSPTFAGEGLVFCLVKDKIPMDVKRNISCPSTDIYLSNNISPCEWVDEYLRRSLPDSYSILSTSGGLTDDVNIYRFGEPIVDFTFKIYKQQRQFNFADVSLIQRISYKDGEIKLAEKLLDILQKKTQLLRNKQTEDFYYIYESVFSFTTDKLVGYAQNVRMLGSDLIKKTQRKLSDPTLSAWQDYSVYINTTIPPILQPVNGGVSAADYQNSLLPASQEQLDNEAQADGTW